MLYRLALLLIAGLFVQGCARPASDEAPPTVTLYSSVDDFLLREIVDDFETQTGITVRLVGDTEATKTTGLMHRLLAERDQPRADVWWSSEPFATQRLADEGLLSTIPKAVHDELGEWPAELVTEHWIGFALRARVIAVRAGEIDDPPTSLQALTDERFRGRVGIARPEFGTTRGHVAALVHACGPEAFEAWLNDMKANDLRVYSSNSAVVRAIAQGEILLALTDTDDVWVAQRNNWPVEVIYEQPSPDSPTGSSRVGLCDAGPMLIPNTVALVNGGPNPVQAQELIEFLLSERTERRIAQSDSRNLPVRPALAAEFAQWGPDAGVMHPVAPVAASVREALEIVERVLGGP